MVRAKSTPSFSFPETSRNSTGWGIQNPHPEGLLDEHRTVFLGRPSMTVDFLPSRTRTVEEEHRRQSLPPMDRYRCRSLREVKKKKQSVFLQRLFETPCILTLTSSKSFPSIPCAANASGDAPPLRNRRRFRPFQGAGRREDQGREGGWERCRQEGWNIHWENGSERGTGKPFEMACLIERRKKEDARETDPIRDRSRTLESTSVAPTMPTR